MSPISFENEINHVGEGWRPTVTELHAKLSETDPHYTILQIKEKFGGLRYYFATEAGAEVREEMDRLVSETEDACWRICEECGEPGTGHSVSGWFRTLCDEHFKEALERRRATWSNSS